MRKLILIALNLLFFATNAWADIGQSFERIRHQARHYDDPGAVCEEVARVEFSAMYPSPQYEVDVGVAYSLRGQTLGELDLVLIDKSTQKVIAVGEVKCYNNLRNGLTKAKQQRQRFFSHLESGQPIVFKNTSTGKTYSYEQFQNVRHFFSVSQRGGKAVGFDFELEHNLDEMGELRDRVVQCQKERLCPGPQKINY